MQDPVARLESWLDEARSAGLREPEAMTLATASLAGKPSARAVLLKRLDASGLSFVTNYESRKAVEIEQNPLAALLFYWDALLRQVRVEGAVVRAGAAESDALHARRARESQLGAWASPQSRVVADHEVLERAVEAQRRRFPDGVPRPPFWGAYRLEPQTFEFWEARPHRLHRRERYRRDGTGWRRDLLAP